MNQLPINGVGVPDDKHSKLDAPALCSLGRECCRVESATARYPTVEELTVTLAVSQCLQASHWQHFSRSNPLLQQLPVATFVPSVVFPVP